MEFCIQAATRMGCDECRTTFDAYGELPPCGNELRPDRSKCEWFDIGLLPENVEAWELYKRIYNQTIPDGFGTGPINIMAAYETMDRMGIDKERQLEMFDSVQRVGMEISELIRSKGA